MNILFIYGIAAMGASRRQGGPELHFDNTGPHSYTESGLAFTGVDLYCQVDLTQKTAQIYVDFATSNEQKISNLRVEDTEFDAALEYGGYTEGCVPIHDNAYDDLPAKDKILLVGFSAMFGLMVAFAGIYMFFIKESTKPTTLLNL